MAGHNIIVIGASSGGVKTLQYLMRGLPNNLPAAGFIVMHLDSRSPSVLAEILARAGRLRCLAAKDEAAAATALTAETAQARKQPQVIRAMLMTSPSRKQETPLNSFFYHHHSRPKPRHRINDVNSLFTLLGHPNQGEEAQEIL